MNQYVRTKYNLNNTPCVPKLFEMEPLNQIIEFAPFEFLEDMKSDFSPIKKKEIFFFTEKMADEYIDKSVEICLKEILAFKKGSFFFDENKWSWKSKVKNSKDESKEL